MMIDAELAAYWDSAETVKHWPADARHDPVAHLAWLDVLRRNLRGGGRHLQVLDVGTGTGWMARLSAELHHQVIGLDQSAAMLAAAQQDLDSAENPVRWVRANALKLEFPDQHFDAITARFVLSVLSQPTTALREWLRVLKPDGRLTLMEDGLTDEADRAAAQAWHIGRPAVLRELPLAQATPEDIADFARLAGYQQIEVGRLAGQLERQFRRGRREYRLGYSLVVAQPQPSLSLPAVN